MSSTCPEGGVAQCSELGEGWLLVHRFPQVDQESVLGPEALDSVVVQGLGLAVDLVTGEGERTRGRSCALQWCGKIAVIWFGRGEDCGVGGVAQLGR